MFIMVFAGLFISIFNNIIVEDEVRFEHQITTDNNQDLIPSDERIPFINCNDWEFDKDGSGSIDQDNESGVPNHTSIYCFFNQLYGHADGDSGLVESVGSGLIILGFYFYKSAEVIGGTTIGAVNSGDVDNKFINIIKIAIILYILNQISSAAISVVSVIINPSGFVNLGGGADGKLGDSSTYYRKASGYAKTGQKIAGGTARRYGGGAYNAVHNMVRKKSDDDK
jgi:hypothetical protein